MDWDHPSIVILHYKYSGLIKLINFIVYLSKYIYWILLLIFNVSSAVFKSSVSRTTLKHVKEIEANLQITIPYDL